MLSMRNLLLAVAGLSAASALSVPRQAPLASTTCDTACQQRQLYAASWELEQRASADPTFYDVPANFSTKLPAGSILKIEPVTDLSNYTVPGPLSMSRILYTTTDLNGTIYPASAYILWPTTQAKVRSADKGFPVVAWAHGTTGVSGACAPSNYRSLQYHFMVPFTLAMEGYVVVAPDYLGLGVSKLPNGQTIRHPWLTGAAQANDIANAIIAARAAFPKYLTCSGQFVTMGHSQGGLAAWAFAERQAAQPVSGYKGTIAIAPPPHIVDQFRIVPENTPASAAIIAGITASYPGYNYSGLTDFSYDRWRNVLEPLQGCFPSSNLLYADALPAQIAKPKWFDEAIPKAWGARAGVGGKKFKGPLLVIAGAGDNVVALTGPAGVDAAVDATCQLIKKGLHESLELSVYEGMDHFPVIQGSHLQWIEWINERLSGKSAPEKECKKTTVKGFRTEFSLGPPFPNFLLTPTGADSWKGLL